MKLIYCLGHFDKFNIKKYIFYKIYINLYITIPKQMNGEEDQNVWSYL